MPPRTRGQGEEDDAEEIGGVSTRNYTVAPVVRSIGAQPSLLADETDRVRASDDPGYDSDLEEVVAWLGKRVPDPVNFFGGIVRQSVDEVLDGPRTGRWEIEQLEKTEATYVGTKLEIVLRTSLELEPGGFMDLDIEGSPVDIKWSKNSTWQIPKEAVNQICLCVGGDATKKRSMSRFRVGVVRCLPEYLNKGEKQGDKKKTLSALGRQAMRMIVEEAPIPESFVASMDPSVRKQVMAESSAQARIRALFQAMPYVPIPRLAIQTIARTSGDPFRRTRADKWRGDPLGGLRALNGKQQGRTIAALGLGKIAPNEWIAVRQDDLDQLPSLRQLETGLLA